MKKRYIYALSFLLPLLTMILMMILFGVTPFGEKSLLIIDGLHQYMPFFSVLYDKLKAGDTLLYTFRTGLGVNFWALFAYYLSSPFNLIILFFKRSQLNMVVSWLIVLKLALSGLTASIYFTNKSKKPGMHIVAVSVAYALNGYMVGYCWNVMWMDAIMIFPLVMLGIERLIEKKDGRLYCLALFYALYCNYYIAFMICIFSVIWYLFYQFTSIKQFFFRGFAFAGYSFLAAGMSAVLLIPAYMAIKQTASGGDMGLPDHSWLGNFWKLIARQYNMGYPITHDNFDGNANLYFGIFSIIFLLLYLMNREIRWIDKMKKVLLILFFYLSFNEQVLNFIWHGFHDQYGIPNRFSFLYGFVLLCMTFEVLEHRESIRTFEPIIAAFLSYVLLGMTLSFSGEKLPTEIIFSSAILLIAYTIILLAMRKNKKHKVFFQYLLVALITGEILVCSVLGFDTNGQINMDKFFYATEDMEKATADVWDGSFYRSELADTKMVDESTWYPMNAIALFGSTARDETVEMMDSLGFHTGCNEYLYKGATPITNLMFNVRYMYYHDDDLLNLGLKHVADYGRMSQYQNPIEGMSIGYGIRDQIDDWYYYSDYPFRVLNDFGATGYDIDDVFENIEIPEPETNGCSVTATNDGEYYFTFEEKEIDNLVFTLDIEKSMKNLYIFYDGTQVENVDIAIDGETMTSGDLDSRMIPIGTVFRGAQVTVEMSLKGENTNGYIRLSAASFDQEQFERLAQEMTIRSFEVTDWNERHIEGKMDASANEYLFFSIPYDEGWKVTVDGKNEETFALGNAFLSVIIPEGEHEVVLDYTPDGFRIGAILSGISIVLFILFNILHIYRKKNRPEEECEEENHEVDDIPKDETGGEYNEEIRSEDCDSNDGSDDAVDSDSTDDGAC